MKTTLTFNLPEDSVELQAALKGGLYKSQIDTLYDSVFRPHLKYNKDELSESELAIIEKLWQNVSEHFEE